MEARGATDHGFTQPTTSPGNNIVKVSVYIESYGKVALLHFSFFLLLLRLLALINILVFWCPVYMYVFIYICRYVCVYVCIFICMHLYAEF